jgi:hypothetical protein
MNLLNTDASEKDIQLGNELAELFTACDNLPVDLALEPMHTLRRIVDDMGSGDVATLSAFTQALYDSQEKLHKESIVYIGAVITLVGCRMLRHDIETGARQIHPFITHTDVAIRKRAWSTLQGQFDKGKLSYEQYLPFFLAHTALH